MKLRSIMILPVFIITFALFGCGEKIPSKEMALAKLEITKALSVMAEKYAPAEIKDAQNKLIESHDLVKNDELDKAKNAAEASMNKAIEAYNKSIPLLAKDTIAIAENSIKEADDANAEVLAEAEYKQAKQVLANSNGMYEQKKYYESYQTAIEADKQAKEARNVALGKKNILRDSINEVKGTLTQAEKYNAVKYAPEKINAANENLNTAETSYTDLTLKKGFAAVAVAATNADEAYLTAVKGTAKDKIDNAAILYDQAEKSEGAQASKDELAGSKEALELAKVNFESGKYKESIASSDESERLSNIVLGSMQVKAKGAVDKAEIVYTQAKDSEGASVAKKELDKAKESLDLAKALLAQGKYKEAIAAAEEAERLAYQVINTKKNAKGLAQADINKNDKYGVIVSEEMEFWNYKVLYNPEKRDCLWRIADKFYKKPVLWPEIYRSNKDQIKNPNLIWPNMILKVPKIEKSTKTKKTDEAVKQESEEPKVQPQSETKIIEKAVEEKAE